MLVNGPRTGASFLELILEMIVAHINLAIKLGIDLLKREALLYHEAVLADR